MLMLIVVRFPMKTGLGHLLGACDDHRRTAANTWGTLIEGPRWRRAGIMEGILIQKFLTYSKRKASEQHKRSI